MTLKYALLVRDFFVARGHWPDVLFIDPVDVAKASYEIDMLWKYNHSLTPIQIKFDNRIPAGWGVVCDFEDLLTIDEQIEGFAFNEPYVPSFQPELSN